MNAATAEFTVKAHTIEGLSHEADRVAVALCGTLYVYTYVSFNIKPIALTAGNSVPALWEAQVEIETRPR